VQDRACIGLDDLHLEVVLVLEQDFSERVHLVVCPNNVWRYGREKSVQAFEVTRCALNNVHRRLGIVKACRVCHVVCNRLDDLGVVYVPEQGKINTTFEEEWLKCLLADGTMLATANIPRTMARSHNPRRNMAIHTSEIIDDEVMLLILIFSKWSICVVLATAKFVRPDKTNAKVSLRIEH